MAETAPQKSGSTALSKAEDVTSVAKQAEKESLKKQEVPSLADEKERNVPPALEKLQDSFEACRVREGEWDRA